MPAGLAGVPHVVTIRFLDDDGAVDVLLPIGLVGWTQDDRRRVGPVDPVGAFDEGDAFAGTPGEVHAISVPLLQERNIEAGAQFPAQNGIIRELGPAGGSVLRS